MHLVDELAENSLEGLLEGSLIQVNNSQKVYFVYHFIEKLN